MPTNILNHLAIIMDGNRRWAFKNNKDTFEGHIAGVKSVKRVIKYALEYQIKWLTLYTFSSENWNRDKNEVENLMSLLSYHLMHEDKLLMKYNIRIRFIGNIDKLAPKLLQQIKQCEARTANNKALNLVIALSYGAREEILIACKNIAKDIENKILQLDKVTEKIFTDNLYSNFMPDPDLIIRTSGERRLSNFLLWQSAYSEFYFTKALWPDFNKYNFNKAIKSFSNRKRRYGAN